MAEKKEEKPSHEKAYDTLKREAKLINKTADTLMVHHASIISNALQKNLMDEAGDIDYNRLKARDHGNKYQLAVRDDISKGYDNVLSDYYKTKHKDMPKGRKESMKASLLGANDVILQEMIESAEEGFTIDAYREAMQKHADQLTASQISRTYMHIEPKEIIDLLKLAHLDDKFDPKLIEQVATPHFKSAIGQLLYHNYTTKGKFKDELWDKLGLRPYMKKDD
jgi:hypothetical protein